MSSPVMYPSYKKRLAPLAEMFAAPAAWLWAPERTVSELEQLLLAAGNADQGNCWWATWEASQLVLREVPLILKARKEATQ